MTPTPSAAPGSPLDLAGRVQKLQSILDVAKQMAAERDIDNLLPLIASHASNVAAAERCSIFILDRKSNELWSKVAQGAKEQIRLPLGSGIAGTVAQTGTVINIEDAYQDERFNRSFDDATGFKTRTILAVPMRDANGEVTGVIQALNKRQGTFNAEDEELLLALGGQAASAVENAQLHGDISRLFEGFVNASVVAIESRDPTTAGHSGRVASLTVELARATMKLSRGPYEGTRFTDEQLREIRYASLLHDFGKVGVREPVLVKADKLYPHELDLLRARFQLARKDRELQSFRRRLEVARQNGPAALAELERQEEQAMLTSLKELDEVMEFILACNRPTVLAEGGFERLAGLSRIAFQDAFGQTQPLLNEHEVKVLSIRKGSLSQDERVEIESHVTHTYKFLSEIPWTPDLRRVPEIAWAHHEKLNGKGYPRRIPAPEIPLQSKMMAISDIYDALTASDRPYKKAIPPTKALDILKSEANEGLIDAELFQVFWEADVPRKALTPPTR
ncbi:MAG TPA: HD domain-containing phosphohydrolase [Myxococcales bacterium]|nr:HD domain-containing phosphohydrolase [Myxococcales bacterium]